MQLFLLLFVHLALAAQPTLLPEPCFHRWLSGYKLTTTGHTKYKVSLQTCENECMQNRKCGAFAFGTTGDVNGTCEIATTRTQRSIGNSTLTISDVDKSPPWDVYIYNEKAECLVRSPLFEENRMGIPIDCFYRLLSGKRLAKPHALKSISVNSLQECQEGCIREGSFSCRSVSYRYMPSGLSYSVSNCELSPFYMTTATSPTSTFDFLDDFDYDYFQREPYCKTTNGGGNYGVCAVVVRRSGRLSPTLVKSNHQVSTPSQCEHLCVQSLFRCRSFAFRHTDRGRDRFGTSNLLSPCQLYESDLSRLPSYNVETDMDYDLYEMGRLMNGKCVLLEQFTNRYRPVTEGPYIGGNYPTGSYPTNYPPNYPPSHDRPQDRQDHRGTDKPALLPAPMEMPFPLPPGEQEGERSQAPSYDGETGRLGCLIRHRTEAYLAPEVSRATFPTKTLEECKQECTRSVEVLRFLCRVMAFRVTSGSGGTCQLSERELRESDLIGSRDGIVFVYDEGVCPRLDGGNRRDYYERDRDRYGSGYYDRYQGQGRYGGGQYGNQYGNQYGGSHYNGRYNDHATDRYSDRYNAPYNPTYRPPQNQWWRYPDSTNSRYDTRYDTHPTRYDTTPTTTVDGERCLHQCIKNPSAGFYYCMTDQQGSWNFCCRPDDQGGQCGFSKDLSFAWCYVGTGPSRDVWRTCSTKRQVQYLHKEEAVGVVKVEGVQSEEAVLNGTDVGHGGGGNGTVV